MSHPPLYNKRHDACDPPLGLYLLFVLAASAGHAQWLNYREPGMPRTRDGNVNMTAPVPRTADGKPDLSGVWMHEITSAAEMKRLYGSRIEEAIKLDVPGMEIGTQYKYFINILLDLPASESIMLPGAVDQMRRNQAQNTLADACTPGLSMGFPLADLVSEPIKIVQAPRQTMILIRSRQLLSVRFIRMVIRPAERIRPPGVQRFLGRTLGGRHIDRGDRRF